MRTNWQKALGRRVRWQAAFVAVGLLAMPLAVQAAVPTSTSIEGALSSAGGGPAADGSYNVVFSIYKDASGGTAVYSETASIAVKGGLFTYQLGSKTPLTATVLANLPTAFLGLKIDLDPELPRQAINSTPFALRAGVAEGLDCSGCVAEKALDPGILAAFTKTSALPAVAKSGNYADLIGTPPIPVVSAAGKSGSYLDLTNLPVFATVAKTGSYTDLLNAPVLSAVAKSNKYADLTGLPTLAALGTSCGTGLAVKGLKADGSLDCVAAASGPIEVKNLPADGIDEISNGLVNNQFVDTINGKAGIPIDDNKPTGTSDTLVFPDIGTAQNFAVNVDISNSDISTIAIQVIDSANPSVTYDLCGVAKDIGTGLAKTPCGQVNVKTLKTSFPSLTVPEKGDLTTWVGQNPKGTWFIKVVDGKYLNNTFDGTINSWGITIQTLSNKKIQVKGDLIVDGKLNGYAMTNFTGGQTYTHWGANTCGTGWTAVSQGAASLMVERQTWGRANGLICMEGATANDQGTGVEWNYRSTCSHVQSAAMPCSVCAPDQGPGRPAGQCFTRFGNAGCPSGWSMMVDGYITQPLEWQSWGQQGDTMCMDKAALTNCNGNGGIGAAWGGYATDNFEAPRACAVCCR